MSTGTAEPDAIVATAAERRQGRALVIVVVAIVWGLMTHGTFAGSGDEPHYLMIAHSLAFDADLDLTNDYREATLIGGGTLEPEAHAVPQGGRLRPVHDIGMPLAFAPVVAVAYTVAARIGGLLPDSILRATRLNQALLLRHQISLVMALLTGLLARELFLLFRGLGGSPRRAFGWALLFAVTPPVLAHAFLFFTEIPTALVALFVFRRLSQQSVRSAGSAALLGALTGYLLLLHVRNVGLVVGLTLLAAGPVSRRIVTERRFAIFLAAVALGVLGRTLTTYVLWGTLVLTPHAALGEIPAAGGALGELFTRATGLLFDREYGLLAYGPIYLLAVPGLWVLAKRRPPLAGHLVIVVTCYLVPVLLPFTNVHGWTGGWSPAARFLVPIAPLLWIAVYQFAAAAARSGTVVVSGLVALQIAIDAFVWQFPKTLWNNGDGLGAFRGSRWLPSWTDPGAALPFAAALATAGVLAYLCARYAVREERTDVSSRPA